MIPQRLACTIRCISTTTKTPLLWKTESESPTTIVQLLSWGRGASGQLGGGIEENRLYPTSVTSLLLPSNFHLSPTPGFISPPLDPSSPSSSTIGTSISCGFFHSSLLVDGKLWIWGEGEGGCLGFGHEKPAFLPTLNPNLTSVRSIALGGMHSVALTEEGDVYTWGNGGLGGLGHPRYHRELLPKKVKELWSGKICHIATSGTHTAAVTDSGELYMWGRDEGDGRLGVGPGRGPNEGGGLSIPSKVKALSSPVSAVSCGLFFTMALTKEGQLWSWGASKYYELGRGDRVGGWKPQPIPSIQDVRISQIATGNFHSLALTDEGKLLSWGYGGQGQLGHPSIENQRIPTLVEALADENIVYIACGGSSSAAITDKGKLYMWGNARDFQLGVPGLPEMQLLPVEVKFLNEDDGLGPHRVLSVAIGVFHAMCLVSRSDAKCSIEHSTEQRQIHDRRHQIPPTENQRAMQKDQCRAREKERQAAMTEEHREAQRQKRCSQYRTRQNNMTPEELQRQKEIRREQYVRRKESSQILSEHSRK